MSTPITCAVWAQIGRAAQPRSEPRLREHLAGCAGCRAELEAVERAAAALKAAPYQPPSADAREQARTRLVAALTPALAVAPAPRRLWLRGVVAIAASLSGATVLAAVATHVVVTRRSEQAAAEAVRVRAPRRVVRVKEDVPVVAPPVQPVAPPEIVPPPAPVRPRAPRPRPVPPAPAAVAPPAIEATPPAPVDPAEIAFNQAWEALRAGDHRGAAALMERAVAGGPLDEDARYWRAIALVHAREKGDARGAMEQFLRAHPASRRAGEVSAMLGWLLVEVGDLARARELFQAAAQDASPGVRQSARAGLERVGR